MKRILTILSTYIILVFILQSCAVVPITGRKQLLLVPDQQVLTLSLMQYNDFINKSEVVKNTNNARMVERVGRRIVKAVENFYKQNGRESELSSFSWEFNLVKSNQINAFCMPGGKIVVFEGILPIAQGDNGLATVIGHEVAHAVAKHSNERMSQKILVDYGKDAITDILADNYKERLITNAVLGLGAEIGIMLPYSREHEYEADELGLIFMAMAGYNPSKAADFWTRMSKGESANKPEFMNTHPSGKNRIKKIKKSLPKAMEYYNRSRLKAK